MIRGRTSVLFLGLVASLLAACGVDAPESLSYTSPITSRVGDEVTAVRPQSTGGPIESYSVSPPLPRGLVLDPKTGVISGTPQAPLDTSEYTVTGTNPSGSVQAMIVVTVKVAPPVSLSYTSPITSRVGDEVTAVRPQSTGGPIESYSVSPPLPRGLVLDPKTGVISGTPQAPLDTSEYTVTGTNPSGSVQAMIVVTVKVAPPVSLSYTSPITSRVGDEVTAVRPQSTGGPIESYSVSPPLPRGLVLDPKTGVISGLPSKPAPETEHRVTGRNAAGSADAVVRVSVTGEVIELHEGKEVVLKGPSKKWPVMYTGVLGGKLQFSRVGYTGRAAVPVGGVVTFGQHISIRVHRFGGYDRIFSYSAINGFKKASADFQVDVRFRVLHLDDSRKVATITLK